MQVITPTDSVFDSSNNAANSSDAGFLFSTSDPKTTPSGPVVSNPFARRSPGSSRAPRQTPPRLRNTLITAVLIILALVGLVAGISWFKARRNASTAQAPNLPTRSSVMSDLFQPHEAFSIQGSDASKLAIFGTGGSTTLAFAAPQGTNTITMPAASGTICLDSNNCQFVRQVDLAQNIAMQGGPGVTLTDRTINNSGVLAVNGLAGRLSIQGTTNQITVATAGNSITLSGPQDLATASSPTFAGLTVTSDLSIAGMAYNWPTSSAAGVLSNNGSGTLSWAPVGACASCATNGGNSFGSTFSLGTTDSQALALITGGTARLNVSSTGLTSIGGPVGTAQLLVVNGDALNTGLRVEGAAGQTANFFQVVESDGSNLLSVYSASSTSKRLSFGPANMEIVAEGTNFRTFRLDTGLASSGTDNWIIGRFGTSGNKVYLGDDGTTSWVQGAHTLGFRGGEGGAPNAAASPHLSITGTGAVAINSTGTAGTVEKFRVNTPTTVDNTAATILSTGAASSKGLVVQGAASQTANLQEWQTDAGAINAFVASNGRFQLSNGLANSIGPSIAASMLGITAGGTSYVPLTLKGATSQTANLQEWQNSSGIVLSGVDSAGSAFFGSTSALTGARLGVTPDAANLKGIIVKGRSSQTANLQEWQSSTGTIMSSVTSTGAIQLGFNVAVQGEYSLGGSFVDLIKRGSSNNVIVGSTSADTVVQGTTTIQFTNGNGAQANFYASSFRPNTTRGVTFGSSTQLWANGYFGSVNASSVGLTVVGSASQTANLQEWQNSSGTVLASVTTAGNATFGGATYDTGSTITSAGALAVAGTAILRDNRANAILTQSSSGLTSNRVATFGNATYGSQWFSLTANGGVGIGADTAGVVGNGRLFVSGATANQPGVVVRGAASQTANLQEWQSSTGTMLSFIDASGNLSVKAATVDGNLTVNGHYISGNTSGSTTVAAEAAAGAGASASVVGNDTAGTVTITTGTGAGSGTVATITFANAYGAAPRVTLTPANGDGAAIQYYVGSSGTTTFTISSNNAPSDSTSYQYNYQVIQ